MIFYFSMNKTLGTGYDIHLLCAMIADHVSLLAIFALNFWTVGCSNLQKNCHIFSNIFDNLMVPELIIKD